MFAKLPSMQMLGRPKRFLLTLLSLFLNLQNNTIQPCRLASVYKETSVLQRQDIEKN